MEKQGERNYNLDVLRCDVIAGNNLMIIHDILTTLEFVVAGILLDVFLVLL